jgi:hypothetical protein
VIGSAGDVHGRDATDDAFYEWLLSDHPAAHAERAWRRGTHYQAERQRAAEVRAWSDKINAQPGAPQNLRDLAASMGPLAGKTAARAEAGYAEPDDLYVARARAQHETHMRVYGPGCQPDYRYPAHLTGPAAANYLPPPQAQAGDGLEPGA